MTEFEEKIYANGSITLSRTLTKGITPMNELVLSRLRTERDYAVENNYITDDGFFIADETELSYHTGISVDVIRNIIKNLTRRKFILPKKVDETRLVSINDEKIMEILEELEKDEPDTYGDYETGLKKVQKAILKLDLIRKEK